MELTPDDIKANEKKEEKDRKKARISLDILIEFIECIKESYEKKINDLAPELLKKDMGLPEGARIPVGPEDLEQEETKQ